MKRLNKTLFLCGFCFLVFHFTSFKNATSQKRVTKFDLRNLLGTWHSIGLPVNYKFSFTNDSVTYSVKLNNEIVHFADKCFYNVHNDSILITTFNSQPTKYGLIRVSDTLLILCLYKNLPGLEYNISSLLCFISKSNSNSSKVTFDNQEVIKQRKNSSDIFILPKKFSGVIAIVFNQKNGIIPNKDSTENNTFTISNTNSFLIYVQPKPDFFNYLTNNIKLYYRNSKDSLIYMPVFKYCEAIQDTTLKDSLHAFCLGYDRIGKQRINEITQNQITENILFFKISKELFYNQNNLGKDSVLYYGKYYKLSYP